MTMQTVVREAKEEDLPQVHKIFEYYVLNTVISFLVQRPPLEYVQSRFETARERHLPYLVAVQSTDEGSEEVVGYTYTSPFRGFMLGYGHTVEMTMMCHPKHTNQGIGSMLMKELLTRLQISKHVSKEAGYEDKPVEFDVKKVMAIMAVDETGLDGGLALRNWYQKFGFEEVGRLRKVGNKREESMYIEGI